MATPRAVFFGIMEAHPTYDEAIILQCQVAFLLGAQLIPQTVPVTVGATDTPVQIGVKIGVAIRAAALASSVNIGAIAVNDIVGLGLQKL